MKITICPNKHGCWGYKDNDCDDCPIGKLIEKQKRKIARLTEENERLKKAVELPFIHKFYIRDIKGNTVTLYQIVYIDDDNAISTELGNSEEKAEARLAELKGGDQE